MQLDIIFPIICLLTGHVTWSNKNAVSITFCHICQYSNVEMNVGGSAQQLTGPEQKLYVHLFLFNIFQYHQNMISDHYRVFLTNTHTHAHTLK